MTMSNKQPTLDTIVSLAKRRGFAFPSSEIYGGISGFYDYGPYGTQMVKNLKDAWWEAFVRAVPNVYGLDTSIIQNPKLWEASGHVSGFNDPMVECSNCKTRYKEDGLDDKTICPNCGEKDTFSEPKQFNMMMKTYLGASEDTESLAYLRPETAGGMFTNYELVRETTRSKIPFGIGQIGKAFRNEISPRDFVFRVRELEQMELQYFVDPKNEKTEYDNLKQFNWDFLTKIVGLKEANLQWHEHGEDERAHYAKAADDIEYNFSFGFKELWGTHNRGDFDLKVHMEASGKDLNYYDVEAKKHYLPYVMESSTGVGRLFLAALTDGYTEEKVQDETRVVLKLAPGIAPIDVAILPLSKKPELQEVAHKIYSTLVETTDVTVEYDETQSIGKRYRRQDEIGTPKCITIDFDSLEDDKVTVRDRDTMEQKRLEISKITEALDG